MAFLDLVRTKWNYRYKTLLLLGVTLFATEFLVRGPGRFLRNGFNDFVSPLVQSKAWVSGTDPYSPQELLRLWPKDAFHPEFLSRDAAAGTMASKDGIPSPYPMTCFVLLAPFSRIPWPTIHILWLGINCVCALLLIGGLFSFAGLSVSDPLTYVYCGLALGLAPLHTAIAGGNLVVIVAASAVSAMWFAKRGHESIAGVLLAIAVCLKPTVGLVFLAYYFFCRRWRTALMGAAVTTLVAAVAILRYGLSPVLWLPSYLTTMDKMFGEGGINDFSTANYLRFHLLNLQTPLYSVVHEAVAANVIAWTVAGVLLLCWTRLAQRTSEQELLDLSALATIALLPVYHRFMDAVVLLLPLCWCLKVHPAKYKRVASVTILLILLFLVPGASVLATLAASGYVSSHVIASSWWNVLVMPHQAWAILGLSLTLICAMSLARKGEISTQTS